MECRGAYAVDLLNALGYDRTSMEYALHGYYREAINADGRSCTHATSELHEWKGDESLAHIVQCILLAEVDNLNDQSYILSLLPLFTGEYLRTHCCCRSKIPYEYQSQGMLWNHLMGIEIRCFPQNDKNSMGCSIPLQPDWWGRGLELRIPIPIPSSFGYPHPHPHYPRGCDLDFE